MSMSLILFYLYFTVTRHSTFDFSRPAAWTDQAQGHRQKLCQIRQNWPAGQNRYRLFTNLKLCIKQAGFLIFAGRKKPFVSRLFQP